MLNMENSKELFRKKISDAFNSLPEINTKTMLDSVKYQGMVKEDGEVEEKWSEKYKKSIDCNNPKGFSQKAHCQGRKKKKETKEATGSGSSGGYEAPLFGEEKDTEKFEAPVAFADSEFVRKSHSETKKIEATEATGSGSVGAYSTPAFLAKSTSKKNWRGKSKTQIPGGTFVSVKKKCKKFPYCNQGDINALNIFKEESVQEAIKTVSEKLNLSENVIKAILDYEYEKLGKERYL
jgi:hypothetical protein